MIWPAISSGPRTDRTRRGRREAVGSFMSARNAAGRLIGFFAGGFIAGFNENLVNMALVAIMGEFSVDAMTAQWLVTGFMVVTVFVVAAMAALYRRLGPRTLLFVALACNALGSMGGLVAPYLCGAVCVAARAGRGHGHFHPPYDERHIGNGGIGEIGHLSRRGQRHDRLGPRRGRLWPPVPSSAPLAGIACSWFPWWFRRL